MFFTLLGVAVFSFAGIAVSVAAVPAHVAEEDPLRVEFATPTSMTQTTPYFAVRGAYPKMKPESAIVTIRNTGTVTAAFDMAVVVPAHSAGAQLADVLRATVTAAGTDTTLFKGPLSAVSFEGSSALPAGTSAGYVVTIDWPDGDKSDNAYQGLELEFDFRARARQAG